MKGEQGTCTGCGEEVTFHKDRRCLPCLRTYQREWSRKQRKTREEFRENEREKCRRTQFRRHHGVEREEADAMAEAQGNRCAACGAEPEGKRHHARLHVDHCHATGKIRGMLCSNCNLALGHLKDDPERIRQLLRYVEHFLD